VNVLLKNIADIQVGYSFRKGIEGTSDGIPVIQMKDITKSEHLNIHNLSLSEQVPYKDVHTVNENDIAFRPRGGTLGCSLVPKSEKVLLLAAPMIRIRIVSDVVKPEFLNWFLNSPSGNLELQKMAEGSVIPMITKQKLEDLTIPLPSLKDQEAIVSVHRLMEREAELEIAIVEKRKLLICDYIMRFLKKV